MSKAFGDGTGKQPAWQSVGLGNRLQRWVSGTGKQTADMGKWGGETACRDGLMSLGDYLRGQVSGKG